MRIKAAGIRPKRTQKQFRLSFLAKRYKRPLASIKNVELALGLSILLTIVLVALAAPWLSPNDPRRQNILRRLEPPSTFSASKPGNLLGTDDLGRDVLARVIFGARTSLTIAALSVAGSSTLGVFLGLLAGYFGRGIDAITMRVVDVQMAFPFILLAIAIVAVIGPGLWNLVMVFILTSWVVYARVIRGSVLSIRENEFVLAAAAMGCSDARIIYRHILPHLLSPVLVIGSFEFGQIIIVESALSFFGLGVPPYVPSWGAMLSEGRQYMETAWWVAVFPGISLTLTVLGANFLGDALRDYLDPQFRM